MPDDESGCEIYLSDLSQRDKPWDEHRSTAATVSSLYKQAGYDRYAERVQQCSRVLEFALTASNAGDLVLRLQSAHFCRVRHCPVCQWRRSLMWRARFFEALPRISQEHPTARWVFLTLTIQNCPLSELRDVLRQMSDAWNRFSRRKNFPALGWVRSVEVTRSKDGFAHPHYHCLLMVPSSYFGKGYLKQADWTQLWQEALRVNYVPIVDVKAVKARFRPDVEDSQQAVYVAICETLKYTVKQADLIADPQWLADLTRQLHKTRAIATGGVLKQYLSDDEPEDLVHAEELSDMAVSDTDPRIWFGWREMIKRYAKTDGR